MMSLAVILLFLSDNRFFFEVGVAAAVANVVADAANQSPDH